MTDIPALKKLDLGCGPNKAEGFLGCDRLAMPNVDVVFEMGRDAWPFEDSSIDEARSSHALEHLTMMERCHFVNELWRVLKPEAKCLLVTPHWASSRAYGDPTHKGFGVTEMWFYYLKREWRLSQAPHTDVKWLPGGFDCDFEATWGYSFHPALNARNDEMRQFAMQWAKEACQDLIATLICKKPAPATEAAPPPPT